MGGRQGRVVWGGLRLDWIRVGIGLWHAREISYGPFPSDVDRAACRGAIRSPVASQLAPEWAQRGKDNLRAKHEVDLGRNPREDESVPERDCETPRASRAPRAQPLRRQRRRR